MDDTKRKGLLRLRLRKILVIFDIYGMGVYIPEAIEAVVKVVEELWRTEQQE